MTKFSLIVSIAAVIAVGCGQHPQQPEAKLVTHEVPVAGNMMSLNDSEAAKTLQTLASQVEPPYYNGGQLRFATVIVLGQAPNDQIHICFSEIRPMPTQGYYANGRREAVRFNWQGKTRGWATGQSDAGCIDQISGWSVRYRILQAEEARKLMAYR